VPDNRRILILPPEEAMRIAAGEVIDRPAAIVREFLDNAIDAGSLNIEISIEEGGCKKVEVSDDGAGLSCEDLEICFLTHATSKIRGLDDLNTAVTLGFRGEALAAINAVARLEILCSVDGRDAWKLETGPSESRSPLIEQTRRTKGATVRALNLYETIPARKRFLKKEGSEASLCRQAFIDKALAFDNINFRFLQDGKLKDFLPAVKSKKQRFAAAVLQAGEEDFLHEIKVTGGGFSAIVVIGGPELYRNDRRQLFIFANGRRVQDYSLVQAVEYGSQGWFPNGTHPVAAVYVEIDPSLADFNIHPAKREVRFRDPGAIHQAISGGVKNFFHSLYLNNSRRGDEEERRDSHKGTKAQRTQRGEEEERDSHEGAKAQRTQRGEEEERDSHKDAKAQREEEGRGSHKGTKAQRAQSGEEGEREFSFEYHHKNFSEINRGMERYDKLSNHNFASSVPLRLRERSSLNEPAPVYGSMRYAGRIFDLFILIEWGDKLYMIDQHAAHERILYNKFLEEPVPKQELLAPIPFTTEGDEEDSFLLANREELSRLGIEIEKERESWSIEALPADWRMGDAETVKEILQLRFAGENMAKRWAATCCCRAAIKDGDHLDEQTAFELGKLALALPDPRCPHGRPVWTEISKEALFKAVRRN
jgi:DNA mismatch repair protein MutL